MHRRSACSEDSMKLAASSPLGLFLSRLTPFLFAALLVSLAITTGCGSGGSGSSGGQTFSGNTNVTVMLTGTANDHLSEFDLGLQSITLTGQSGNTATLLSTPASGQPLRAEFMHLNGTAQPLLTATIPQDIYTSATVT